MTASIEELPLAVTGRAATKAPAMVAFSLGPALLLVSTSLGGTSVWPAVTLAAVSITLAILVARNDRPYVALGADGLVVHCLGTRTVAWSQVTALDMCHRCSWWSPWSSRCCSAPQAER